MLSLEPRENRDFVSSSTAEAETLATRALQKRQILCFESQVNKCKFPADLPHEHL